MNPIERSIVYPILALMTLLACTSTYLLHKAWAREVAYGMVIDSLCESIDRTSKSIVEQ